ncbi:hypothetical protein [Streptomyces sp. rh34]|uniref:hypothetical protein n=1 Tax=Streptomyces sp. rh34 TaxID=2034272 RepID=UPI000BEF5FAE|nr:hypothetical protein [Streptomyces sp. rh34]
MDTAVQAWLISQLGADTDLIDLTVRYTRLGTARAVALEVVRERLAALLASPGSVSVSGVVSVNFGANITAYERQILSLESGEPPAPDDPDDGDTRDRLGIMYLTERPRR